METKSTGSYLKKIGFLIAFIFAVIFILGTTKSTFAASKCVVSFHITSGKEYTNLRQLVSAGNYITMPTAPSGSMATGICWSTEPKGSEHINAGDRVKITKNTKFYRISKRRYTINLCTTNGKYWKKVITDGKAKFPAADVGNGDMVLGWSAAKNRSTNPTYFTGDTIPCKNANYYMVVYRKSQNKAPASIAKSKKYDKVWFVGDSRAYGMKLTLGSSIPSNVSIVYKCGKGLTWFKKEGYSTLLKQVRNASSNSTKAVIINLGVNDLRNYAGYPEYMKKVSEKLSSYGCDMYYMSINPINSAIITNYHGKSRTEKQITDFNNLIYSKLCSGVNKSFTYIDSYNYLRKKGWISNQRNDGLHYSNETYLRIYDYCIKSIG